MKKGIRFLLRIVLKMIYPIIGLIREKRQDDIEGLLEKLNNIFQDPKTTSYIERETVNNKEYDLDVIIPAYNTEKYIKKCIDSVLFQKTKYKFRIIVIDDGSTDETGKIIDEYKCYENVKIVHQQNKGLSGARNTGLELLNSKYVTFVDSDDLLYPDALDALLEEAFHKKADIVQGEFCVIDENDALIEKKVRPKPILTGFSWGKVYDTALFDNVKFPEFYWFEDSVNAHIVFALAKRVFFIQKEIYGYRRNMNGITKTSQGKPKSLDALYIHLQLFADRKKFGIPINQEYYDFLLNVSLLTGKRIFKMPIHTKKMCFCIYSDFIHREFAEYKTKKYPLIEYALKNNCYVLWILESLAF